MALNINPYNYPACFSIPRRLTADSAWIEHIPFVGFLVSVLRPRIFVELGAHRGVSYCAVCQAVDELGLDTKCVAVDTWQGDPHSGAYGPEILDDLRKHHDPLYGRFSRLMQATFDEALTTVENGSVDLLHIDGNHTYQAVKRDFETWLPKLSQRSVVLFHDICVQRDDFGVWRLWNELVEKYRSFSFTHGHGLGVLAVGGDVPSEFGQLLGLSEESADLVRKTFREVGRAVALRVDAMRVLDESERRLQQRVAELEVAVCFRDSELERIHRSLGWKIVEGLGRVADGILPRETGRRRVYDFFYRIIRTAVNDGLRPAVQQAHESLLRHYRPYELWIRRNEPDQSELARMAIESRSWSYRPKVSIVTPVYNPNRDDLTQCIISVLNQTYDNWELCLVDGGSDRAYVKEVIQDFADKDPRIKCKFLSSNQGIVGNSNEALKLTSGEYVGFLDHDDTLAPFALYEVVKVLNGRPEIDFFYSDEDKVSPRGTKRYYPHFKPEFSPDTLLSYNYACHFAVVRRTLLEGLGGFRQGYDGAQDYDLILRIADKTKKIFHISKILYHWRASSTSTSRKPEAKLYAVKAGKDAIYDCLNRNGLEAEVVDGLFIGPYRVKYPIRSSQKVCIIIPTKDQVHLLKQCVSSILAKTDYQHFEILIVDNQSREQKTYDFFNGVKKHQKIRVLSYDKPFNFSAINNYAVRSIDSEHLVFLNNDTEVISHEWLEAMLEFSQRKGVGVVGAKLYYPNDTIQHAGVIVGLGGVAAHSHKHLPRSSRGYMGRAQIIQNLSAVTAACMMVRREVFDEVGGFEERLSHAFNDVDFCLKVREKGYLVVFTPYAELYHHESVSRGFEDTPERKARFRKEVELIQDKWKQVLESGDPYYSPNLTIDREDFGIRL